MESKYFINIHCELYDSICKEMRASAWEVDEKFGLLFLETIKLDYKFEVRDKQKFLWAKFKYNF
jgi:hypothetical protein